MPFAWTVALALRTSSWRRVVRTAAAGGGDDDERRAVLSNLGTHRLFGWLGKSLGGGTEDGRESRRRARALARASRDAPGRGGVARVRGAESGAQIRSGRAPARHPARRRRGSATRQEGLRGTVHKGGAPRVLPPGTRVGRDARGVGGPRARRRGQSAHGPPCGRAVSRGPQRGERVARGPRAVGHARARRDPPTPRRQRGGPRDPDGAVPGVHTQGSLIRACPPQWGTSSPSNAPAHLRDDWEIRGFPRGLLWHLRCSDFLWRYQRLEGGATKGAALSAAAVLVMRRRMRPTSQPLRRWY